MQRRTFCVSLTAGIVHTIDMTGFSITVTGEEKTHLYSDTDDADERFGQRRDVRLAGGPYVDESPLYVPRELRINDGTSLTLRES